MTKPVFLACVVSLTAFAQSTAVPGFELERLRLNPGAHEGLLVGGGDLLPAKSFRIAFFGHYEHDPLVYRAEDGTKLATIIGSRVTAHLAAAWSPTSWLEVGLQLPVVLFQGGAKGLDDVAVTSPQTTAVGTPFLQARVGLLRQADGKPVDLAAGVALGLPIGSAAALTRDPTVSVLPSVGVGRSIGKVRLAADVGATIRGGQSLSPENPDAHDALGSQLDLGLGASTFLSSALRGEVSLRGTVPFTRTAPAAELMVGARYPVGMVELSALVGGGIGRLPGTPVFRALLGIAWVGGGEPAAPVLEPDSDGDGIKDADDACPSTPGVAEASGCPDQDHDGVADSADECPTVKGPVALKGCPDSDGDGVLDHVDSCSSEPGPVALHGCPPKDADGDGLTDDQDACPTKAGPKERKGCPMPDADGDGVADDLDNCPKLAGVPENQGCPKDQKQLVVMTKEKLVIKERVYFDTGRSTIQARSFFLLDQVAQILVEHPEVERLTVEGHTDNSGSAELNRSLSLARAESVKTYLSKHGVAPARIEARGYGPDRPVADNHTADGREQNRRVEFVFSTPETVKTQTVTPAP